MRKMAQVMYNCDEIKDVSVLPHFGNTLSLVIDFANDDDDVRETVQYRLDRKQVKKLYKSLKKHMYK